MPEPRNGTKLSAVERVIVCPNCKKEIRLTESLAAPLVEATRLRGPSGRRRPVHEDLTGPRFRNRSKRLSRNSPTCMTSRRTARSPSSRRGRLSNIRLRAPGDLQGIAGKSLDEIEGLEIVMLPAGDAAR